MCTNEFKSTKAITLIALVISILVLLILAGVSIGLLVGENGITGRAVTAKKTYDIAGAKEQVELLVEGYIGDYYGKKYTSGESVSQDIGTYVATQLAIDTTVGDYTLETSGVNVTLKKGEETVAKGKINSSGGLEWSNSLVATWEQDGTSVTNGEVTLTVGQAVTGYSVDVEINNATQTISNWYVLGAKNGELLITTNTSYENVTLSGIEDYVGGVAKLNTAASKYSDGDMANSARTIDMEDINRITGYNPEVDGSNVGRIDEYGKKVTFTLKDDGFVWYKETGKTTEDGCLDDTKFEYWNGMELVTLGIGESVDITGTAVDYNASSVDEITKSMLFTGTGFYPGADGAYWLGSPCVWIWNNVAYCLHNVYYDRICKEGLLFASDGHSESHSNGLRPVISLKSSVNVTNAGVLSNKI